MYCSNCGTKMNEYAEICVNCGTSVTNHSQTKTTTTVDQPNIIINILSVCCFPILGIIMYFVWKEKQPKAAKSALTFGLIGFAITILFWILSFLLGMADAFLYYY